MSGGVDLHSHTTASDGALPPRELVREAARRGVRVLAITDHDSTEALAEAFDEVAKHPPMTLVPGIEINCDVDGGEIHILGYFLDYEAEWFQTFLREQRSERKERVYRIAARLAGPGMPIDPEEVFALVKEGSAGRPHIAQVMLARGYVKSYREAFDRFLRAGGQANVPRKKLSPAQAIVIIRKAGGVPVLAHPGVADMDEVIPDLVAKMKEGYDMVIVSRYLPGALSEDDDAVTAFGNWMFTKMINLLFGGSYTDSLVMFRAWKVDLERELPTRYPRAGIEPYLSIRCAKRGLGILRENQEVAAANRLLDAKRFLDEKLPFHHRNPPVALALEELARLKPIAEVPQQSANHHSLGRA